MLDKYLQSELYDFTDELLQAQQKVRVKVTGVSMFPFLKQGDIVTIHKCSIEELKKGDIIGFKAQGKWVAHRLIKINKNKSETFLVCKGDTGRRFDNHVTEKDYIGKIISVSRKNKERQLKSPYLKFKSKLITKFPFFFTYFFVFYLRIIKFSASKTKNIGSIKSKLSFILKGTRRQAALAFMLSFFQGILPFIIFYCIKSLIDLLSNSALNPDKTVVFHATLWLVSFTTLAFLLLALCNSFSNLYREYLSQSITKHIYAHIQLKHIALDMAHLEDPSQQNKIHRAVQEAHFRPLKLVTSSLSLIQSLASVAIILVLLFHVSWAALALVVLASLPAFWVSYKHSRRLYHFKKQSSATERAMYYYNRVLTGLPFVKELKLFNLGDFFLSKFNSAQKKLFDAKISLSKKLLRIEFMSHLMAIILIFCSFFYVSNLAIQGTISIGLVVLFLLVFYRGFSVMRDLVKSVAGIMEDSIYLDDFFDFLSLKPLEATQAKIKDLKPLQKGIFIQNISFQYPSSRRLALDSVSITLPAGKTIALVGANGSGKTTLIKLLCGFYQPQTGQILYDNESLADINSEALRKQITVVFQDFALYNLSAAENIAMGDTAKALNKQDIISAAKQAGIAEILEKLPLGYENLIGNLFEKSEELSIGQWQKMAIAKAFYRNAPILLMDEPSSALDAITELQLLQNLKKLAQDKTVVIVSHRFSTIQWADVIYVFDQGKVVESGNHAALMANKSNYYSMYQASETKTY